MATGKMLFPMDGWPGTLRPLSSDTSETLDDDIESKRSDGGGPLF
jgi:hypothetical protein